MISPEKIIFIPNAADFSLSEELLNYFDVKTFRQEHDLDGKFVVTYVGAHGIANHLIQVLDTAELLQDTNVLFLLIGDGMQKKELETEAKRRSLSNIRFIESVPKKEVFKYILASEAGTSVLKKAETFKTIYSNKTFDYMSCQKPILMVIDGVSKQLVEEAEAGLFCEPEHPEDFAEKIRFYLTHPEIAKRHGLNGYRYAKQNFDREVLANRYLTCLKEVT